MSGPFATIRTPHFVERHIEPSHGPLIGLSLLLRESMDGRQQALLTMRGDGFSADLFLDMRTVAALASMFAATAADAAERREAA